MSRAVQVQNRSRRVPSLSLYLRLKRVVSGPEALETKESEDPGSTCLTGCPRFFAPYHSTQVQLHNPPFSDFRAACYAKDESC